MAREHRLISSREILKYYYVFARQIIDVLPQTKEFSRGCRKRNGEIGVSQLAGLNVLVVVLMLDGSWTPGQFGGRFQVQLTGALTTSPDHNLSIIT